MAPRDDSPPLILRVTARGIIPASAIDAETLAGIRIGSDLQAKVLRVEASKPLRAWWGLMSAVVKTDPHRFVSPRALSNHILLKHDLVEEELLMGGGIIKIPMSLTSFSDAELSRLVEMAKLIIEVDLIPGIDIEALMLAAKRGDI